MASDHLSAAEAQWREQFAAMKTALATLKVPSQESTTGHTEEDFDDELLEGYSSGTSGRDIWDFISDVGDDDDDSDLFESEGIDEISGNDTDWFISRCAEIATKNGLSADVFHTQISSVLSSNRPDEEVQAELTDLVGFDDLDFIIEILAHKTQIIESSSSPAQHEPTGRRLLSKSQREDVLRQQDVRHKSAALAPSFAKEPQYPHVYKAYSAGNTISVTGKKYGLPPGSERLQFDKYEEYSIPAGRKGSLGPGQRLVKISDLDGLCRNTFKGYKALNRMQSLVFPVAYKTSENMLICAPTGAVCCFVAQPFQVE
jgi:antiviral helicase SLH1